MRLPPRNRRRPSRAAVVRRREPEPLRRSRLAAKSVQIRLAREEDQARQLGLLWTGCADRLLSPPRLGPDLSPSSKLRSRECCQPFGRCGARAEASWDEWWRNLASEFVRHERR